MVPLEVAIAVGLAAGFASGLLGIGGGLIIVPSLVLMGFDPKVAIATSLVAIIAITMSGGATHGRLGHMKGRTAALLAVPAAFGAQVGALLLIGTPTTVLEVVYGVFLLIMSLRFLKGAGQPSSGPPRSDPRVIAPFGFLVGMVGAYLGIGGGVLMVLFMVLYMGYDIREAIGTSTVVIILVSLAATAQYAHQGVPDVQAGIAIGLSGALTAVLGARTTLAVDRVTLRRIFGAFLMVIALRFIGVYEAVASLL